MNDIFYCGFDIGSTTIKSVVEDASHHILYSTYRRHYSDIRHAVFTILREIGVQLHNPDLCILVTGSAGIGVAQRLGLEFCQEVIASSHAVESLLPETNVAIELGGEDAKITFFGATLDQRMNGTCAGGTGAFIDQMSMLLDTDPMGLNELAKGYKLIYPIAARCGVFAKTDIQPLINEGARHEDIAASIFQAVVNQTVSVLACGHPIRGKVAFLGGPLYFLSSLRERFIETLHLTPENALIPRNGNLFVAMGAARLAHEVNSIEFSALLDRMEKYSELESNEVLRLEPLFNDTAEYEEFVKKHDRRAPRGNLEQYRGRAFLGIDAGSTTTKAVLMGENREILFDYYGSNEGKPLEKTIEILREIEKHLPEGVTIANACVTGYGEGLIQKALNVDEGEIETIAHYRAADVFVPGVEFILDIGGQDMKCMMLKNGVFESIMLNEACSSGCGSFIETFARSLGYTTESFAKEARFAPAPIDLGTRCTVFMNSRVKQAQKEGASVGDISAGLSYSVIKNALYKVIKLRNTSAIGKKIIVQGGTFLNDAVLRAFERISNKTAIRPDIAGLMGAYGCAIIAQTRCPKDKLHSAIRFGKQLDEFSFNITMRRCGGCQNHCLLTINKFSDGTSFITGNRCERPLGKVTQTDVPNLYRYKAERTFQYQSLPAKDAPRGIIGIPRVLNMYENYPFWHTLLTQLGFSVLLSPCSSKQIYEMGIESIPSESVCYPAKLVHGHIAWLISQKPDYIFYPCISYEEKEVQSANNHYNCPIVTSYPEVIKNNTEALAGIPFFNPFFNLNDRKNLWQRLYEELQKFSNVTAGEVRRATIQAFKERDRYKEDIRRAGDDALEYIHKHHSRGIVLAGRPYHIDKEINHGIPEMIAGFGIAVLTEDSVAHRGDTGDRLRVIDQWAYHSRLYCAARFVTEQPDLEFIQLNSFGCGLDAVTTDQVMEILQAKSRIYTTLKIDEGSNIGAARIRIRSLIAAIHERERLNYVGESREACPKPLLFTEEKRKNYTLLAPQMSPIHFRLLEQAFKLSHYRFKVLPDRGHEDVEEGLKYVNNDACYPTIITTGQIVRAFTSGEYDPNTTSVCITQTGGGCRATNYVAFIRKALREAGFPQVAVLPLSAQGFENHPGFSFELPLVKRSIMSFVLGDVLMQCLYRTRPYEVSPGSANAMYEKWNAACIQQMEKMTFPQYRQLCHDIVADFDALPLKNIVKPRVGIVGEILVKFHPLANNHLVELLESEGAEAVVPDLLGFFLYVTADSGFLYENLGQSLKQHIISQTITKTIEYYQHPALDALRNSRRFSASKSIKELMELAKPILQIGNNNGEGWFLTAEMIELLQSGVSNILCLQPFACLPNHVTGKGMIKALRERHPKANIVPIDYDPGASEVNQLNRIKLMLSVAHKQISKAEVIPFGHESTDDGSIAYCLPPIASFRPDCVIKQSL
ncbi:MAG: 2-hydroxyacyl-CoA dehydratase [Proteobacteria bacterium]|nr:2-hydroxyacyl-CoA dehydratase [Pseudomonadota bacterium]